MENCNRKIFDTVIDNSAQNEKDLDDLNRIANDVRKLIIEAAWKSKSAQTVIGFLVSELQKFKAKSGSLLYCVNLPTLAS